MKNRKKRRRQLIVAFVLLYTIGLPIKNIVLATEETSNETVITEKIETRESTTAEKNTSNSEDVESDTTSTLEEAESTEINSSETVLEESKILADTPKVKSSEKQEASKELRSSTQQNEGRPSTKVVTSGTFPNGSTATWQFDDTTGTLTISGGTLVNPSNSFGVLTGIPVSDITNIVFEDKLFLSGSCQNLFYEGAVTNLNLSNLDTSKATNMSYMFANSAAVSLDLSNFDTSKVTSMSYMFYESAATSLDLSNFGTSKVTNMSNMFAGSAATSLDLSSFDTSNVTRMNLMFKESAATSINLSSFDTSNVTQMGSLFASSAVTSLDLSNFDTSKVTAMAYMFYETAVTSLDLSNFDTSNALNMSNMFASSAVTSLDLSNFDTSNVSNMSNMFAAVSKLQIITLGNDFQFLSTAANLPSPNTTADYTGKWQNVSSGTVDKPKGSFIGTATELMSNYTGSTMADTYVWQPVLLEVNVQDSILMVGDTWKQEDNLVDATDNAGNPVDFKDITVTGSVDTTKPGVTTVDYSYGGITSTATITVLETMPASWVNFFVDGTNVRSIPGSALSTPEWDLTTGLWDKWNPETIKVPTDKIPSEPIKQGYIFKGWEDTTGSIVDFNTLDLDLNSRHEFNFYAVFEKVNSTNPSVEPPTKPGEGPNVVSPPTPGSGGNQTLSNGSESNTGNMTITSQGNVSTISPATVQRGKLAKLGENSSLLLQGFGLLLVLIGMIFFLFKRKNTRY
ncbi:BspA family leucine-rich repeat surface protein [Listeria monocytogenes]|nr:BspA family leucine-rich repeat surface protein [Listeria monocytogenes]EHD1764947.1 BspA family leucine-rich repeat surface protein [Listeria monocytogenes]